MLKLNIGINRNIMEFKVGRTRVFRSGHWRINRNIMEFKGFFGKFE